MTQSIPLKESAMNRARVESLAGDLSRVATGFDADGFIATVMNQLPRLELKSRIACVADALASYLPDDVGAATKILIAALPPHDDATFTGSDFGLYTYAPYSDWIARYGCTRDDLDTSLDALKEMTKQTMNAVSQWSRDPDYHVRRLASEGTRPKLPWSPRITLPVDAAIPVLDELFADSSRFVTQSVANHLNDITTIDPELALATLGRWRAANRQRPKEMEFLIRQSLRTLIKKGHPGAFEFLGLSTTPAVEVITLRLDATEVAIGDGLGIDCTLRATGTTTEHLVIDYVLTYPRARAGHAEAVFKGTTITLAPGESRTVSRTQPLRSTSSRKLGPGTGRLHIQINGRRIAEAAFELLPSQ
jgi:3-methyladenine DNA glycosylase AlkC